MKPRNLRELEVDSIAKVEAEARILEKDRSPIELKLPSAGIPVALHEFSQLYVSLSGGL